MSRDLPSTYVEGFHDEAACRAMVYKPLGKTGMDVSILSLGAVRCVCLGLLLAYTAIHRGVPHLSYAALSKFRARIHLTSQHTRTLLSHPHSQSALGSVFNETIEAESLKVVSEALKNGINYIDVAAWYGFGKAETVLGKALALVPRESYFVSSKCCRYLPDVLETFDWSAERTIRSVDESLERLGVEYIDVMQIHDPEFCPDLDIICNVTLPALQQCKDAGKIRFIGITGYPLEAQRYIIENTIVKVDTRFVLYDWFLRFLSL